MGPIMPDVAGSTRMMLQATATMPRATIIILVDDLKT